jgi:hypothetical protein
MLCLVWADRVVVTGYDGNEYHQTFEFDRKIGRGYEVCRLHQAAFPCLACAAMNIEANRVRAAIETRLTRCVRRRQIGAQNGSLAEMPTTPTARGW